MSPRDACAPFGSHLTCLLAPKRPRRRVGSACSGSEAAPRRWYGRVMPCAVVFGATNEATHYVVLKKTAAEVAVALGRARDEFGQFEDENGKSVWISARNVWYIEDRDDQQTAAAS